MLNRALPFASSVLKSLTCIINFRSVIYHVSLFARACFASFSGTGALGKWEVDRFVEHSTIFEGPMTHANIIDWLMILCWRIIETQLDNRKRMEVKIAAFLMKRLCWLLIYRSVKLLETYLIIATRKWIVQEFLKAKQSRPWKYWNQAIRTTNCNFRPMFHIVVDLCNFVSF